MDDKIMFCYFIGSHENSTMVVRRKAVKKWEGDCFAACLSRNPVDAVRYAVKHGINVTEFDLPTHKKAS